MPTYEYACKGKCGEHLEVHQSFTDAPLETCPTCGGPLRKVFGNIGISFKGSGFYKTDSRSSGNGAKHKADKSDAKGDTAKSESKSESKSASGSSDTKSDSSTSKADSKSDSKSKPSTPAAAAS